MLNLAKEEMPYECKYEYQRLNSPDEQTHNVSKRRDGFNFLVYWHYLFLMPIIGKGCCCQKFCIWGLAYGNAYKSYDIVRLL